MHEHLFHILFTAIPFVALAILSFKNTKFSSNVHAYLGITLVLFILFHFSPLSMTMAFHHQSADATSSHPCCTPQASAVITTYILFVVFTFYLFKQIYSPNAVKPVFISYFNPRSPPIVI